MVLGILFLLLGRRERRLELIFFWRSLISFAWFTSDLQITQLILKGINLLYEWILSRLREFRHYRDRIFRGWHYWLKCWWLAMMVGGVWLTWVLYLPVSVDGWGCEAWSLIYWNLMRLKSGGKVQRVTWCVRCWSWCWCLRLGSWCRDRMAWTGIDVIDVLPSWFELLRCGCDLVMGEEGWLIDDLAFIGWPGWPHGLFRKTFRFFLVPFLYR